MTCLQLLQPRQLDRVRRVVGQRRGRRAGRGLKMKLKLASKPTLVDQLHHPGEVVVGLAGEADDEVAADSASSGRIARSLRTVLLYSIAV